jgi:ribosome modulation factor
MDDYSAHYERLAFTEGWDAHQRGESLDDNPYESISQRYESWIEGWQRRDKNHGTGKYPLVNPNG